MVEEILLYIWLSTLIVSHLRRLSEPAFHPTYEGQTKLGLDLKLSWGDTRWTEEQFSKS